MLFFTMKSLRFASRLYQIIRPCYSAAEAVCDDDEDNDLDGATDCEDNDCADHPDCVPPFDQASLQDRLTDECGGCHGARGGLRLTGDFVAETVNVPSQQSDLDRIEPGRHQESYLWHKIAGSHRGPEADGFGVVMPQFGVPWSDADVSRLADWIDALEVPEP